MYLGETFQTPPRAYLPAMPCFGDNMERVRKLCPQSTVFGWGSVKRGSTLAVAGGSCIKYLTQNISQGGGANIQGTEDLPTENKTKTK